MKRKKPILKKHFKSKKGFSLLELICAIMIMAIAVSATATGLAISYESITKNSLMNKASAKAQMYCDIVMTYVEKTPSHNPTSVWDSSLDLSKNKLFANQPNTGLKFDSIIQTSINDDVNALDNSMTAKQYDTASIGSRDFDISEMAYVVEFQGKYVNSEGKEMVSFKITTYVNYGTNGTTTCEGVVTKPEFAE